MKNLSKIVIGGFYTLGVIFTTQVVMSSLDTSTLNSLSSFINMSVTHQFFGQHMEPDDEPFYATVSADKMNVFYIGVNNPVSVAASGVDNENLEVSIEGGNIEHEAGNYYNVTVSKPGLTTVILKDKKTGDEARHEFRTKRIPDPVAKLSNNKTDGIIKSGEMKAQAGVMAILENFDFDARCSIISYTLYKTEAGSEEVLETNNEGGRFGERAKELVSTARPGDTYSIVNVKAKCPGDKVARHVNGLAFQIK